MKKVSSSNGLEKYPKLRFYIDSSNEQTPYKHLILRDITFPAGKKNKELGDFQSYSISNTGGFVPQDEQFEGGSLEKADKSLYIIVSPNSFAYNPARINVGSIGYQNEGKNVIISSLYEVFKTVDICNDSYLWHYLNTKKFNNYVGKYAEGGVRQYLFYDNFCRIPIHLPSIDEQNKVSEFLNFIDKKIQTQQQLVELLKKYKKGVMSSHFTKVERDKTATKILLSNDCLFFSGGTPKSTEKSFYEGEIPFIRSGEIHKDKTELFINELALKNSSAKMVKKGDLLLAMYGATSGEVSISQINGAINQAVLCIRPRNINTYYLKNILEYNKNKIISTYIQGGQGNLSAEIIKNLSFKIPAEKEQNIFNSYISQIDIIIEKNSKKIEFIRKYKKGLLQQLFI